jgi:hypothetical protein
MKDLRKIPPDSEFWTNPPLPKADNNNGGWLSWCQRMSEDILNKTKPAVILADEGDLKHAGIRGGVKNNGAVEQAQS